MSGNADQALNALFEAEREAMAVAPHGDPTYYALLDRLARGAIPPLDLPQGSSALSGAARVAPWATGAGVVAVVAAGIWGGLQLAGHREAAPQPSVPRAAVFAPAVDAPAVAAEIAPRTAAEVSGAEPIAQPRATALEEANREPASAAATLDADAARDRARRAPASTRAENLAEELRLLAGARAAWKSGRQAEALGWLAEHAKRFPQGLLSEDRGALEAVLLCETGKLAEGRDHARRFLAQHPRSTLVDTVRSACR